jgi:nitrite reductase/ring-hydroxylating ferredoxin subunit
MKHVVGRVDEFPEGRGRIVTVAMRSIGIFRMGDRFFALRNRCPHQGGPLCEGPVLPWIDAPAPGDVRVREGKWRVACPWHNWEYDLETGESWFDPKKSRVKAYPVTVERSMDLVAGPYVAETYAVDVEGENVVVELG